MTVDDCVNAIADFGFTRPQSQFLVHVLRHSGVCLNRQYRTFAKLTQGQQVHDFFRLLVDMKYAVACACPDGRGRFYHLHATRLYRAIGAPDHPHRRIGSLGRAVERIMLLDAILATPDTAWLATAEEKRAALSRLNHLDKGDATSVASAVEHLSRWTPDRLPIGVSPDDSPVFLYVVTTRRIAPFRAFLTAQMHVFRVLQAWTIQLLIPLPLRDTEPACRATFEAELPSLIRDLPGTPGTSLSGTRACNLACQLLPSCFHGLEHVVGSA